MMTKADTLPPAKQLEVAQPGQTAWLADFMALPWRAQVA
jgi:hypothetical protein